MTKDFLNWHSKKSQIDEKESRIFFHEREIWFAHLGTNVGFEQDGKGENFGRPVIIFRKFNKEIFWAIPLTTKEKKGMFYSKIDLRDGIHRMAILSQMRLLDSKRLYQKIGMIDTQTETQLRKELIELFCN